MVMDQTRAHEVLTWMHGGAAPTALTAPMRLRQMTANGTSTTNGTEVVTGGGYTSGTGAPTLTYSAPVSGSQASSSAVTITNYPRSESVVGVEVWDSSGTPKRVELGALVQPKAMAAGDTLSYAIAAVGSAVA